MFKTFLKRVVPKKYHERLFQLSLGFFGLHYFKSYSQEGEDMILRRFLENKNKGFYVDVGANHPKRFSNTYFFYKLGWRGINIEAMPGSMQAFHRVRSRDINIEAAVSNENSEMTYYIFNDPALNGFSKELAELYKKNGYKLLSEKKMKTKKLSDILDEYLPKNQHIDFLSIDVEGLDLSVLQSNDWGKYSPDFILVEILDNNLSKINDDEVNKFLAGKGYQIKAKSYNTAIFQKIS